MKVKLTAVLVVFLLIRYMAMFADNGICLIKYTVKVELLSGKQVTGEYVGANNWMRHGRSVLDAIQNKDTVFYQEEAMYGDGNFVLDGKFIPVRFPGGGDGSFYNPSMLYFSPKEEQIELSMKDIKEIEVLGVSFLSDNNYLDFMAGGVDTNELYCASVPAEKRVVGELGKEEIEILKTRQFLFMEFYEIDLSEYAIVFSNDPLASRDWVNKIVGKYFDPDNIYSDEQVVEDWQTKEKRYFKLKEQLKNRNVYCYRVYGQGC